MIPIFTAVSAAACGKPRASGDDPAPNPKRAPPAHVNPARAGMIRTGRPCSCAARRKPRASGDDPARASRYRFALM